MKDFIKFLAEDAAKGDFVKLDVLHAGKKSGKTTLLQKVIEQANLAAEETKKTGEAAVTATVAVDKFNTQVVNPKNKSYVKGWYDAQKAMVTVLIRVGDKKFISHFTEEYLTAPEIVMAEAIKKAFAEAIEEVPEVSKMLDGWFKVNMPLSAGSYSLKSDGVGRDPAISKFPCINAKVKHPLSDYEDTLEAVIIDLNDGARWTRDQIADWLETLDLDLRFDGGTNKDT